MLAPDANLHRFAAAYHRFCDRPYWNRLWTLQEIVVGKRGEIWCDAAILELQLLIQIGSYYSAGHRVPALQQQIATLKKYL